MSPFTRRPATVGQALRSGALTALTIFTAAALGYCTVVLAVGMGLISQVAVNEAPLDSPDASLTIEQRSARDVRALFTAHDCWTGQDDMPVDMRGEYPGHVIVTRASAVQPVYSHALVGRALDQVFGSDSDSQLTVHAFCR